jgi:hypothetical protein
VGPGAVSTEARDTVPRAARAARRSQQRTRTPARSPRGPQNLCGNLLCPPFLAKSLEKLPR